MMSRLADHPNQTASPQHTQDASQKDADIASGPGKMGLSTNSTGRTG
jgi:hypothetical protein